MREQHQSDVLQASCAMKNQLPGLSVSSTDQYMDGLTDTEIPQCVLDRGRRMSRSASCMSELVRQELSDYIDNKNEHLPSLSSLSLTDKNKVSYNPDSTLGSSVGSKKPLQPTSKSIDSWQRGDNSELTRKYSPISIELSKSHIILEDSDIRPRTSSLPTPPMLPKPPTSARLSCHLNRRARCTNKIIRDSNS